MLIKRVVFSIVAFIGVCNINAQRLSDYNLAFSRLPDRWDEALPLGNGMLGTLVWQKGDNLRFSLDRADLWDERPAIDLSKFNFKWVEQQVAKGQYDTVQQLGDAPYEAIPYPTKIPAAALEFNIASLGKVKTATLDIRTATAKVTWVDGAELETFVDASRPFGAFRFTRVPENIVPKMMIPAYAGSQQDNGSSSGGQSLSNLGYTKGVIQQDGHHITYTQPGSNGFRYEVSVWWRYRNGTIEGVWSIVSYSAKDQRNHVAENTCAEKIRLPYQQLLTSHVQWWSRFWQRSSVLLPDTLLQRQYYLEMYKLGSAARTGAPPITLQAVWTADNGSLPPWKGDIHNDLNTQLSYWPAYPGNHLSEAASYTDWLWQVRETNKKYTKQFFSTEGLNVPGVATLSGQPLGGWIQYSFSPTVGAWLAQHFYWQWKYSMDETFLRTRAYPYLHDVATFLSGITRLKDGKRSLPLSSSPEYHDNAITAWYADGNTNYDIALMRFAFDAAADAAKAMNKQDEAGHWKELQAQLPALAADSTGLMMSPREERSESHRHHSNLMAIYPLGLLNPEKPADKVVIDNSLRWMQHTGTRAWCGYSFSWAASLYARNKDGENAAKQLNIFASNFCSANSFHLNGDQKGGQHSDFTYRPFTLEGNFAFAQGVHEMLLQSYSGVLEIFPAVPEQWKNITFCNLRAEGAFLVSARKVNGVVEEVKIISVKGGTARLRLPFKTWITRNGNGVLSKETDHGIMAISFKQGGSIVLKNAYE